MSEHNFKNYRVRVSANGHDSEITKRLCEISDENFYEGIIDIRGDDLYWDSYESDMLTLSSEFPNVTFSLLIQSYWKITNVVYKNGKSTDPQHGKVKFWEKQFSDDDLKERQVEEKYVNDQAIDLDRIIKGLRKSYESNDLLVANLLEEFKSQIKHIDADYFHKSFRQCDVLNSGKMDMVMWHALHLSERFWVLLRKQYPSA